MGKRLENMFSLEIAPLVDADSIETELLISNLESESLMEHHELIHSNTVNIEGSVIQPNSMELVEKKGEPVQAQTLQKVNCEMCVDDGKSCRKQISSTNVSRIEWKLERERKRKERRKAINI